MLDKITSILHQKFKEDCNGNPFDLLEDAPEAKCKIARFQYVEGEVAVYKFDKRNDASQMIEIFPFFENVTNLKKMCDFILFYKNKRAQLFVVLCNLKSDENGSDSAQMRAAEVFIDFIMKTLVRIYPTENFDFKIKKVHYSSNKKSVQSRTTSFNKTQDAYYFHSENAKITVCNLNKICR
jgi:hypothetical protein